MKHLRAAADGDMMRARRERGIAVLGALILTATVIAVAVSVSVRTEYDIAATARVLEAGRAAQVFAGLEHAARALLQVDAKAAQFDALGEEWATAELGETVPGAEGRARVCDLQGLFNLNSLAFDPSGQGVASYSPIGRPETAGSATSGGRSTADHWPQANPQQNAAARFSRLLAMLDLDTALLGAVLDWLDADGDTRFPHGAEDDYYLERNPPYRAANRAFAHVSELRLVRGIDREVFERLAPYVTVLPRFTAINVNSAPTVVLMSIAPGIDQGAARMIERARAVRPFHSLEEFLALPPAASVSRPAHGLTTRSEFFAVDMEVASGDSELVARALLGRPHAGDPMVIARTRGFFHE